MATENLPELKKERTSMESDDVVYAKDAEIQQTKPSKTGDAAADFLAKYDGRAPPTYTEESNKQLLRKIDRTIMPMMMCTYVMQYVDKSALSYAAVFELREDLNLKGAEYSLLGSLFYIGYLVAEYPQAIITQKFPAGRALGIMVFLWGLVMMSTALSETFSHIAAIRFIQGLLEAAITPCFVVLTGMWYKRDEQPLRVCIWYSMNGVGNMIGSLLAYAMAQIKVNNIPSWKWIFIIEGLVTVFWGVFVYFYFPSNPMTAWFLTEEQKVQAIERVRSNRTGVLNTQTKWDQVYEAINPLKDPQGWFLFFICTFNEVVNGGVSNFKALIIKSIGWSNLQTSCFALAYGAGLSIEILSAGYLATKFRNSRLWVMNAFLVPSFIGLLLQLVLDNESESGRAGKMVGVVLMPSFVGSLALTMGLPAQNTAGYTKRAFVTGMAFIGYCVGNIVGPQAFYDGQDPEYLTGLCVCMGCFGVQWILYTALRFYYVGQNKKRDKAEQEGAEQTAEGAEFQDITDMQNTRFRYVY